MAKNVYAPSDLSIKNIYNKTASCHMLMLHKDLPVIPIMVFAITGFICLVWEYLISLNAILKKRLSNKTLYFTIDCIVSSSLTPFQCFLLN